MNSPTSSSAADHGQHRARAGLGESPLERPTPPAPAASLKGGIDGLKIVTRSADAAEVVGALQRQLEQRAPGFFEGASVVLELDQPQVVGRLVAGVCALLDQSGIVLKSVSTSPDGAPPARIRHPEPPEQDTGAFVTRTLRSGQRTAHAGSVVIIGDVNAGAEVRAGGSVVVWGRLRGNVEAGLSGGDAVVCALDLTPTQLRIGTAVARAPDGARVAPFPEVARRVGEAIVVEPWQ
jgi:septum site-determining protein MinC